MGVTPLAAGADSRAAAHLAATAGHTVVQ
jgi:hypothetical protein